MGEDNKKLGRREYSDKLESFGVELFINDNERVR